MIDEGKSNKELAEADFPTYISTFRGLDRDLPELENHDGARRITPTLIGNREDRGGTTTMEMPWSSWTNFTDGSHLTRFSGSAIVTHAWSKPKEGRLNFSPELSSLHLTLDPQHGTSLFTSTLLSDGLMNGMFFQFGESTRYTQSTEKQYKL